jgi:hypothetical protein
MYQPGIFMMHTGRSANIFGAALRAIMSGTCATADKVVAHMQKNETFWYEGGELWAVMDSQRLHKCVSGLLASYNANPKQFEAVNVVLNSWTVTPEDVLNKLSKCFSNASGSASVDVGHADAKELSIRHAWKIHRMLQHNCDIYKRRGNLMTVAGTTLFVATTVASVTSVAADTYAASSSDSLMVTPEQWSALPGWLHPWLIGLPAIGGLVTTALSRFRYVSKWGSMHMAKMQIESEIFKFRTESEEYDPLGSSQKDNSDKKKGNDNKKTKRDTKIPNNAGTRKLFSSRVSEIHSKLLGGEMETDSFHHRTEKKDDVSVPLLSDAEKGEVDDKITDLQGEAYFKHRLTPLLRGLELEAPRLSRRSFKYEVIILITTMLTTLMATLGIKVWVPVAVAISGAFVSFQTYESLPGQLAAVNSAITDLNSFSHDWASMGVLERRGRLAKKNMVKTTESAILRVHTAHTAGAGGVQTSDKAKSDEPDDEDDKNSKEK